MKIQVQTTGFIANLIISIILSGAFIWAIIYGFQADENFKWLTGLGIMGLLFICVFPIITAWDLSDNIPEVKELKISNTNYAKTRIRLPSFWWVVLWCILASITFGLTWLLALFLTSGNIDVEITDDIAFASGLSENIPNKTSIVSNMPSNQRNNVEEIKKWKDLLDSGAISEDEFHVKKNELLN